MVVKYTIYITTNGDNKFIYKLGTRPEMSDFNVAPVSKYFYTRDLAIIDAKKQLKKMGVEAENIILCDN